MSEDPLAIKEIDHIEILCGNAKQAMYFYANTFGFSPVAYRGPETGYSKAASFVLKQNKIHLILTTPLYSDHHYSELLSLHGDTTRGVAFEVVNCEAFYNTAISRGGKSIEAPTEEEDENGTAKRAAIATYGNVIHPIIERKNYTGVFYPGFVPYSDLFSPIPTADDIGLLRVDHVVGNVELGKMNEWVKFYEDVLGFTEMTHFSDEDISTEYSSLMSKVLSNGNNKIKFPINEPAQGRRKSQIEEYLDFHNGPGVQHIAMLSGDIVKTISKLRKQGVQFLTIPKTYYDELPTRIGEIAEKFEEIAMLGILADRDDDGYLLQLFTKPVQDRPTLFFEIIQRKGSQGFGIGNFKALFEAIEREQEKRGNL